MGSVWKLRVWVLIILCSYPLFGLTVSSYPDEGFKFNCGQTLCSFPYQYCDTEGGDYRCLYCRDDFCHSKDQLPDQCRTYCTGKYQLSSTPGPGDSKLGNVTDIGEPTMPYNVLIPLWLIVGILLVILLVIVAVIILYCRSTRQNSRSRPIITSPSDEESQNNTSQNDSEQTSLIDRKESFDSGNSSQNSFKAFASSAIHNEFNSSSMSPPQAVTAPSDASSVTGPKEIGDSMMPSEFATSFPASIVTQPQERGESRHHEGYIEPNLLKNSFPEGNGGREEGDIGFPDVTVARDKLVMSSVAYKNLTFKDTCESTHVKSEPCC